MQSVTNEVVTQEELGGSKTHTTLSGIKYRVDDELTVLIAVINLIKMSYYIVY